MSIAELERETLEALPLRNTMSLITIDQATLLNGLNVLNGNNIGAIANVIADGNESNMGQVNNSNDIVTCVVGHAFAGKEGCTAN
jgi:hypothetical protein